ncbi:hypothetical protein BGZ54_003790, partial [Gamsiella multidivaricata]
MPAAFVRLDTLPITNNGKVDHRALPVPDSEAFVSRDYETPQGEIETALAAIWAELLKIDRVGRHDNFFLLGGHSLLAVRLMNRVSNLGAQVPMSILFASPTLSAFAEAIKNGLAQEDQSLIVITPVPRDGPLPLSFAQQRLWFLAQLEGVSDIYHVPAALRLVGSLDKDAWQRALNTLLARHESLRSVFVTVDGQPEVQLLPKELELPIAYRDLCGTQDIGVQLEELIAQAICVPFDLENGPLIRSELVLVAPDEHIFLLTQHHIVSDGWSIGVLVRELNELYAAYCAGDSDPLPPLAIQYPDYAVWQRQWLTEDRLQEQGSFWRKTLAGAPVSIDLPTDRPRPAQQSFAGAEAPIRLNPELTSALKRLSQQHGATLFMTILAAWSTVLSHLSGQDDVVIGTPSANRSHQQIENLIGFFVNTLALRIDLSGDPSVKQLLGRVQQTTVSAQAHQDLPFEQVVEIVQPPRRVDQTPLFQVLFAWENNEIGRWQLPGIEVEPMDVSYNISKFDLELGLSEENDTISGALRYSTALFDRSTIDRHIGYLHAVLQAMVDSTAQNVMEIDLLGSQEKELLLQTWNATSTNYPDQACIHQLFESQVKQTPGAIALVHKDGSLSYCELNVRANRLARRLIDLGVGPGSFVATVLSRSFDLVTAQLAILKAGAAYVPIDPKAPVERQVYIASDSAACLLIAHEDSDIPAALQTPLLRLPAKSAVVTDGPNALDINWKSSSLDVAYVMYTSGSTGLPKGVLVPHRGISRLVLNSGYVDIGHDDCVIFGANPAFDASTFEVWAPLLNGGRMVIVDMDTLTDPQRMTEVLDQHGVTVLFLTTVLFNQFVAAIGCVLARLKYVLTGGEQGSIESFAELLQYGGRVRVINAYGPTESTMIATTYEATAGAIACLEKLPIGRPIGNTQVYVLDKRGQPVPLGVAGELYVGGSGVANGYLNRPDLTAERFLPNPFSQNVDAMMYRTGDLVR